MKLLVRALKRVTQLACGALLVSLPFIGIAQAGNPAQCAAYANQAVMQQGRNLQNGCGFTGPRWGSNFGVHLTWCLGAPTSAINAERNARVNMLASCTGSGGGGGGGGAQAKVCVWDLPNYQGAKICVTPGMSDSQINPAWNDRVSSLKVYGGAKIRLCQNANYLGFCNTFSTNRPLLGGALNNKVSSYQVLN